MDVHYILLLISSHKQISGSYSPVSCEYAGWNALFIYCQGFLERFSTAQHATKQAICCCAHSQCPTVSKVIWTLLYHFLLEALNALQKKKCLLNQEPYATAAQYYCTSPKYYCTETPIYIIHSPVLLHAHSSSKLACLLHFHWQCNSL